MDRCDLHPDCQGQGCEFDPKDCPRVRDGHFVNGYKHEKRTPDHKFEPGPFGVCKRCGNERHDNP